MMPANFGPLATTAPFPMPLSTVGHSMIGIASSGSTAAPTTAATTMMPYAGAALSPPSYDAIALNPNGPRSRTNLFVRKLASAVVEQDLKNLFVPYGEILSFALMRDIHTGDSLGTAFVRFATHEQAKAAMTALDETPLYGRPISIQWAKRQHDSTPVGEARTKIHKLFVRNIPLDVSTRRLRQVFAQYGTISNVTLHTDTAPPTTNSPNHSVASQVNERASWSLDADPAQAPTGSAHESVRNIAFVVYQEDGAANAAVEALHNTSPFPSCDGVPLMVKLAEDNRQRLERRMRFQDGDTTVPLVSMPTLGHESGVQPAPYMNGPMLVTATQTAGSNAPNTVPGAAAATTTVSYPPPMLGGAATGGSYVLLSHPAGGPPCPYWLQSVTNAAASSTSGPGVPQSAERAATGTPPVLYTLPFGQAMPPPGLAPHAVPAQMQHTFFMPVASGALAPCGGVPVGMPGAFAMASAYSPPQVTPQPHHGQGASSRSMSTTASTPRMPQPLVCPQMNVNSASNSISSFAINNTSQGNGNPSGPIRSAHSPVRATAASLLGPSSVNSRVSGFSASHAPWRESHDLSGGSVVRSRTSSVRFPPAASSTTSASPVVPVLTKSHPVMGFAPGHSIDFGVNGITLSSTQPRETTDSSVDPEATYTDQDTAYSSVRLDNSANLVGSHLLCGSPRDEQDARHEANIAMTDMSDEQLLELARSMALLEDI